MNTDKNNKKRLHPAHFPSINRHNTPNIILLTVCSKERKKIFARKEVFDIFIETWKKADHWAVGKFIIMPDHIHLFCTNANLNHTDLESWVKYWKSLITKRWPYKDEKPIWQQDYWDRQLRKGEHYLKKWEYIQNNSVNHGLVRKSEDWLYQGEINILNWD